MLALAARRIAPRLWHRPQQARPHPPRRTLCLPSGDDAALSLLTDTDLRAVLHRLAPLALAAHARHAELSDWAATTQLAPSDAAELRRLAPVAAIASRLHGLRSSVDDTAALLSDPASDGELRALARDELASLRAQQPDIAADLLPALLRQRNPDTDACDHAASGAPAAAILEIRAGTGGDEAALFAAELAEMYEAHAAHAGWRVTELSRTETALRGARETVLRVRGHGAYATLRGEAGVHRVQRVPATETAGRLHTSAASVAVLADVSDGGKTRVPALDPSEIRVDVYRASGAGGQHVNTTESAVRATHVPTGIVATSQDERSQHRNRATALAALATRVAAAKAAADVAERHGARRAQLGAVAGERSDRIRTYNFAQKRVTDHRVAPDARVIAALPALADRMPSKSAQLASVMQGGAALAGVMEAVRTAQTLEQVGDLLEEAEQARTDDADEIRRALADDEA